MTDLQGLGRVRSRLPSTSIRENIMVQRIWDASGFRARLSTGVGFGKYQEPAVSNWRQLYWAAILEVNTAKMPERVNVAEEAIRARTSFNDNISRDERIAIQHAVSSLSVLKRELR
jgi:hypothetical protein